VDFSTLFGLCCFWDLGNIYYLLFPSGKYRQAFARQRAKCFLKKARRKSRLYFIFEARKPRLLAVDEAQKKEQALGEA